MVTASLSFLTARIMHKRLRPRVHAFAYGVFYLHFPLSRTEQLRRPFFAVDRWNLLSFYRRDHGARDGSDLSNWIAGILSRHNLAEADGEVVLITMPRILGHVFNPVSFWLCLDRQGEVRAVLSEVNNTFGESHSYLSYHDDHRVIRADDWLDARKVFHVSPFLDVAGTYRFRFAVAEGRAAIHINLFDEGGLMLATSVTGRTQPITAAAVVRMFFLYPLVTFKTIGMIHFEALRLLAKGIRHRAKPLPPAEEVTR